MYAQVGASSFATEVVLPAAWADMACKYEALARVAGMEKTGTRDAALRCASRAWPGSLREAELAGPRVCARRLAIARLGLASPAMTRAAWWAEADARAVVSWMELHALLADQVAWKRAGGRGTHEAFLRSLRPPASGRWPRADVLARIGGERVRPRQAYAWLATRAGISGSELDQVLFARDAQSHACAPDPDDLEIG